MAHSVRFHPEAAREVQGIVDWYLQRSADAAAGFVAELSHAVKQTAEIPESWPRHKANTRRYVFRVYPYSLVYRIVGEEVTIVAVAHAKRKPGYWVSRTE